MLSLALYKRSLMDGASGDPYPGSEAEVWQVVELANSYYHAAIVLFRDAEEKDPLAFAPASLCAIHAIELYLNAFLRHEGSSPGQIRARMHNLADPRFVAALKLRAKTARHLADITERREYLISRYAPELVSRHTELNRLSATLVEVMTKMGGHLRATGTGASA